jgi:hypothetical protein
MPGFLKIIIKMAGADFFSEAIGGMIQKLEACTPRTIVYYYTIDIHIYFSVIFNIEY